VSKYCEGAEIEVRHELYVAETTKVREFDLPKGGLDLGMPAKFLSLNQLSVITYHNRS